MAVPPGNRRRRYCRIITKTIRRMPLRHRGAARARLRPLPMVSMTRTRLAGSPNRHRYSRRNALCTKLSTTHTMLIQCTRYMNHTHTFHRSHNTRRLHLWRPTTRLQKATSTPPRHSPIKPRFPTTRIQLQHLRFTLPHLLFLAHALPRKSIQTIPHANLLRNLPSRPHSRLSTHMAT